MLTLTVRRHFDAAHKLNDYVGACANLHGHTWKVDVILDVSNDVQPNGMSLDFKTLKPLIDSVLPDHAYVNDIWPDINPTAENLCKRIYAELCKKGLSQVRTVRVWESEDCCAEFTPTTDRDYMYLASQKVGQI